MASQHSPAVSAEDFARRHIGPSPAELATMLEVIGVASVEELIGRTVPDQIRTPMSGELPPPLSEQAALARLGELAAANRRRTPLIGMGYYDTHMPAVIRRNVLENPAWYTAYTPYQPEISQGRLEALLNFQTMVLELTGLEVANASLLDEATAAAEAMSMARRLSRADSPRFLVDADTHPQTIAVLRTRAEPVGVEVVVGAVDDDALAAGAFGVLLSYPTSTGDIADWRATIASAQQAGAVAVVATDLLALTLLTSPAELGADIAVGSAQRFGVPLGYGGPHAAFIAARASAARTLPGRIVGVSTDAAGRPALRLALQTREQHIRREKATSNICTSQVLLANIAGLYAAWHGPAGLRSIATRIAHYSATSAAMLDAAGFTLAHRHCFDTVTVVGVAADELLATARNHDLDLRRVRDDAVAFSFDETTDVDIVRRLLATFGVDLGEGAFTDALADALPQPLLRTSEYLTQSVFNTLHTEPEMLRYLRRLADRDLALDRTMIPLGSCTMKLNATTEMESITWPQFAGLHPYCPDDESVGTRTLISELESWLATLTGYAAVSVQPNAGSQGEFAGLLAIRAYHRSRGDEHRDVCLIPASAHGTNAASAVMAGMRVRVVATDDDGNVDLGDLDRQIADSGAALAAIMVTYPSTHGVFEERIGEICARVHDAGGQVYVDGANLNALVGLAQPGHFGADVSHLNLHKTFCIPHGGGGPGVGPIGVRAHLVPFLPGDPLGTPQNGCGPVSAARFGSAGILQIPWAYIAMMGEAGLRAATTTAIVAANYLAARLDPHFPVLYRGANGFVGHECIIDLRPMTKATGVTVDDVAKRLMDYGFHAPTMSFPVAGTLMIEPTESETLTELDRFCAAMIAIADEVARVARGEWPVEQSPLRLAPHTAEDLIGDWDRPYPRQLGAYPLVALRRDKYFPPVSRIDGAAGDRNLVCTCEPLESYAEHLSSAD